MRSRVLPPVSTQGHPEERVLGLVQGSHPGPQVVLFGGMHGNEPAGLAAIRRVVAALQERTADLRGAVLGLAGNLAALAQGRRYVARDLNRGWGNEALQRLSAAGAGDVVAEDRQQREILEILVDLERRSPLPLVVFDLHSTSGDSTPFVALADTLSSRRLALALRLPVLFGLDECLTGTAAGFLAERGHAAIVIEGGQNDRPETVERLEASIWLGLVAAGVLPAAHAPNLRAHADALARANAVVPSCLEIRHRQALVPGDGFRMRPGFKSFQKVYQGQLLASDRQGEIRAQHSCLLLMPLYQEQGDDGFFLACPLSRRFLVLSTLLRRLRAEWLLRLLPGVSAPPGQPDSLAVARLAERPRTLRALQLFGYRRSEPLADGRTLLSRRACRRPG